MIARLLSRLGLNLGSEDDLLKANKANVGGFYERSDIVEVNSDFMRNNGLDWRTLPEIETAEDLCGIDEYTRSIEAILAGFKSNNIEVVKDPRMSVLLPYWRSRARHTEAVICVRHPAAVAASLEKRNGLRKTYSVALWEQYTLAALRNSRRLNRSVVVYEQMLADPRKALMKMIEDIPSLKARKLSEQTIQRAIEVIIPDMDHSAETDHEFDCPPSISSFYSRILRGDASVPLKRNMGDVSGEVIHLEAAHQRAKAIIERQKADQAAAQDQITALRAAIETRDTAIENAVIAFGLENQLIPTATDVSEAQIERLKLAGLLRANVQVTKKPVDGTNGSWESLLRHSDALLQSYRDEVEALHKRSTQHTLKMVDLEVRLARATAANDIAESRARQLGALDKEVPELRERNRDLEANIRELTSQLENRQATLDASLAARETLSRELNRARVELDENRQQLSEAHSEIRGLQARIETSDAEFQRNLDLSAAVDDLTAKLQGRQAALDASLAERRALLEQLDEAHNELGATRNSLQSELDATRSELGDLHSELEHAQAQLEDIAALEASLKAANAEKTEADTLAEQARNDAAQLRLDIEAAQAAMAKTKAEFNTNLASREADLREVEAELVSTKRAFEEAELRASEAHENTGPLKSKLAQTEEYAAQSAADAKALRQELDALQRASNRSIEGLSQTIRSLNAELAEADLRAENALQRTEAAAADLRTQKDAWIAVISHASVIDQLLSPRLGRFTVPVRTIRKQLVKMRSIAVRAHATAASELK